MDTSFMSSLLQHGSKQYDELASILIQIADDILINTAIEKHQSASIPIDSKTFQEYLLPFDGALQCVFEMGFQEDNDRFTFFDGTSVENLKMIRDELHKHRSKHVTSPEVIQSQNRIFQRLRSQFEGSRIYENQTLQDKVKSIVPVEQLKSQAQKRKDKPSDSSALPSFQYSFLMELRDWYQTFFSWKDAPKCNNCDTTQKANSIGRMAPSSEDLKWLAYNVEVYECPSCSKILKYPRYNHPEKLLDTREGRCGEWANCFTAICRALGFEARYVVDWTDHVWTEIFIPEWDRWIHCDHGNHACDNPLMYEQGWKKKLTLIVAANAEELVDVTWRYSVDRKGLRERRKAMLNEQWLKETIQVLNETVSIVHNQERRLELERRREIELKEFEQVKDVNPDGYEGRTTGSLEWRLARGETGHGTVQKPSEMVVYAPIELTDVEVENKVFHLKYSSRSDKYNRLSNGKETVTEWKAMTCRSRDMVREEDCDTKAAYLCRREGSNDGYICWKINIPSSHCISELQIRVESSVFESGSVGWLLCSDRRSDVIKPGKASVYLTEYKNSRSISVHSYVRGGSGDLAWQKAQLFRESANQENQSSFVIFIKLQKQG